MAELREAETNAVTSRVSTVAPRLVLAGAAGVIVGAFGPWEVIKFTTGGSVVFAGTHGRGGFVEPGMITLALGLVLLALGLTRLATTVTAGWATATAASLLFVAVVKVVTASRDKFGMASSVGWGLALTVLAAGLALGGSIAALMSQLDAEPESS